jgi:hypothetical protein
MSGGTWLVVGQSAIAAVFGLLGVFVGAWRTGVNQKRERQDVLVKEKLNELYGPLVAMREEIRVKSEVRTKVSSATNEYLQEQYVGIDDADAKRRIAHAGTMKLESILDYNNKQMEETILPLYRKMLERLSTHLWLAEASTIAHYYASFVEFIELWNRATTHPGEIFTKLNSRESLLKPFYDDIFLQFTRLKDSLKK